MRTYYTVRMQDQLTAKGVDFYTVDLDETKSMWGVMGKHSTCSALELETCFETKFFDAIIFSGVLGYGVNDSNACDRALQSIAKVSAPGAVLVIGWDENVFPGDPLANEAYNGCFEPYAGLVGTPRVRCASGQLDKNRGEASKVYDILRRKPHSQPWPPEDQPRTKPLSIAGDERASSGSTRTGE